MNAIHNKDIKPCRKIRNPLSLKSAFEMTEQHQTLTPTGNSSRLKLVGIALFLILIWGSAFTMIDVAVLTLSPAWIVAYRMVIGAVFVYAISRLQGHRLPRLSDTRWRWYAVLGLVGASLPFLLISHGQIKVDSGISAIIVGSMPLITIILAHFFTDEKLNFWKTIGFVLGFIGVVILFLPETLSLALISDWPSQILILIAAFSYAATTIIASRAPDTPSPVGATMLLISGAILSMGWALGTEGLPVIPDTVALFCVLGLGFGSTGIATILYLWFIDTAGPSNMAKANYFVPVCSVILGVWLLSEPLTWRIYASLGAIILGVIISRKMR